MPTTPNQQPYKSVHQTAISVCMLGLRCVRAAHCCNCSTRCIYFIYFYFSMKSTQGIFYARTTVTAVVQMIFIIDSASFNIPSTEHC